MTIGARFRWAAGVVGLTLLVAVPAAAERKLARRTRTPSEPIARAIQNRNPPPSAPGVEAAVGRLRRALGAATRGPATEGPANTEESYIARSARGHVRSLVAPPGHAFLVPDRGDRSPEGRALTFLREHSVAFGLSGQEVSLDTLPTPKRQGRSSVRLRQRFRGLPVFGASAVVQVEPTGGVSFALVDLARTDAGMHRPGFSTVPALSGQEAVESARALVPSGVDLSALLVDGPELMVFEPSVVGMSGSSRLAWHVRVRHAQAPVDEVVLVDAQAGAVVFHYSAIKRAKNRSVFDGNNVPGSLGSLVRSEGQAPSGIADADAAYGYLGDAHDFYFTRFGRDSYDAKGAPLLARVRYCPTGQDCSVTPNDSAFWNGSEIRVGEDFAVDDVLAHELTHGVIESEAQFIFWGESGALDEAFADIFGEFVDLTNTGGTDTPGVRWLIGEDLPSGAIRDMQDPTAFGQPDRRYSVLWYVDQGDNRGVHFNSGVANKLAYLLTDGGTFNSETVAAQGLTRVARLFYEAQAQLLGPASDYFDLYAALRQAAVNLGWDGAELAALEAASRAVEIDLPGASMTIYSEDFEGAFPGAWQVFDDSVFTWGTSANAEWGVSTQRASSGVRSAYSAAGGTAPAPPGGPYKPEMDTWMIYGPFSLASVTEAWAEFDVFIDVEPPDPPFNYDEIFWGLSSDPALLNFYGYAVEPDPSGLTPGWVPELMSFRDVDALAQSFGDSILGETQVWLAFNFYSDDICPPGCFFAPEPEGVYVDNLVIRKAVPQSADLSVTKTNGSSSVVAGQGVTWTIQVSNSGPDPVSLARVTDTVPGTVLAVSWICSASSGSSCGVPNGSGSVDQPISVLAGGLVTFEVAGTLALSATGSLVNTATVSLPDGFTDPVPGNNAATDTDTILTPVFLSVDDVSMPEGDSGTTDAVFTVTLAPPSTLPVSVSYATVPGTAIPGVDYTAMSGVLSFSPGETSKTIQVPVVGDTDAEPDESYFVSLYGPMNATIADGQGLGTILDDDVGGGGPGTGLPAELVSGFEDVRSLAALPGPLTAEHRYLLEQKPYSSYEAVLDEISGDVQILDVDRLAADGIAVLQSASAVSGVGASLSLRWSNATASAVTDETLRIMSGGCTTGCGADDTYRLRFYETTCSIPRFNNSGTQITVLVLQNPTGAAMSGTVYFWSAAGALSGSSAFSLAARATLALNTASVPGVSGQSGAITLAHDGRYGSLSGKTVALEPATGFSFDSPMQWRAAR